MRISTAELKLLIRLVVAEAEINPAVEVDQLLMTLQKQVEHRDENYKGGRSWDKEHTQTQLKKAALRRNRKLRPKLDDVDYHPLMGNYKPE